MIGNRGTKVWPGKMKETFCVDEWRCRFMTSKGSSINHPEVVSLLQKLSEAGIDFVHTENLYTFDGKAGYTVAQNEQ